MLGLYAVDVGMKPAPGTHGLIRLKTSMENIWQHAKQESYEEGSSIFLKPNPEAKRTEENNKLLLNNNKFRKFYKKIIQGTQELCA
jgi:hypothetical protein